MRIVLVVSRVILEVRNVLEFVQKVHRSPIINRLDISLLQTRSPLFEFIIAAQLIGLAAVVEFQEGARRETLSAVRNVDKHGAREGSRM